MSLAGVEAAEVDVEKLPGPLEWEGPVAGVALEMEIHIPLLVLALRRA
jgi:hypothetical protein